MKDNNKDSYWVPPYTSIGGPYRNEAYQNPKYVARHKRRKSREAKAELKAKEQDQGQEM